MTTMNENQKRIGAIADTFNDLVEKQDRERALEFLNEIYDMGVSDGKSSALAEVEQIVETEIDNFFGTEGISNTTLIKREALQSNIRLAISSKRKELLPANEQQHEAISKN